MCQWGRVRIILATRPNLVEFGEQGRAFNRTRWNLSCGAVTASQTGHHFDFCMGTNHSRFPSPGAFWISHPGNTFTGNVAVASEGTGDHDAS